MIVVPIWFSGHIVLWEESGFGWYWDAISDEWADWLTLLFLGIAAFLFMRRLISAKARLDSSISDYLLIIVTALPFMTGYFLAHGSLNFISFNDMWTIHVLSAEIMIFLTVFLFCRTRMNEKECTGCAACELNCPTGALCSTDEGKFRIFTHAHYLCIWCGACVCSCPEEAAGLKHEIMVTKFFNIFSPNMIRSIELETCRRCGANFAPIPQLDMIAQKVSEDYLFLCLPCRKRNFSVALYNLDSSNKPPVRI
jgi:ferredoxin